MEESIDYCQGFTGVGYHGRYKMDSLESVEMVVRSALVQIDVVMLEQRSYVRFKTTFHRFVVEPSSHMTRGY